MLNIYQKENNNILKYVVPMTNGKKKVKYNFMKKVQKDRNKRQN